MIGQTISHYKITAKLGEGGMGVVYKAEDTSLGRAVALKFLAEHLTRDDEARKRFDREARAAASLDHPNVCTVHEVGEADGSTFLAMAFIEGQSLDELIGQGPLPITKALGIAEQIARALQAAHEKGIVHRDIKPANVMVDAHGHVKVMDFGLALLTEGSKLTQLDSRIGTVAYMSPEQAQGAEVDHRTDIWALGCVLYEMVCGQRPFKGQYDQALIYEIVQEEPAPLTGLRTGVPVELELLIRKCMAKEPRDRYQNAADLIVDVRTLAERLKSGRSTVLRTGVDAQSPDVGRQSQRGASGGVTSPAANQEETSAAARFIPGRERIAWVAATLAAIIALTVSFVHFREAPPEPPEKPLRRFAFTPENFDTNQNVAVISPNGEHIAYVAGAFPTKLWIQDLDQSRPRELEGTEGALRPFWSPGSDFIAYFANSQLSKIPVEGGTVIDLCPLPGLSLELYGGTWSPDGQSIVFNASNPGRLMEIPARGGSPKLLIEPKESEQMLGFGAPHYLRYGAASRAVLFTLGQLFEGELVVQNLETGDRETLGVTGALPYYSPSGHILYQPSSSQSGLLWALPFSLSSLEATGEPFPVAENTRWPSVAGDGTLVYREEGGPRQTQLIWRNRRGDILGALSRRWQAVRHLNLNWDGQRLAVEVLDSGDPDIWVCDLVRQIWTRVTQSPGLDLRPTWSPDGDTIAFSATTDTGASLAIFRRPADGTGEAEPFVPHDTQEVVSDWSHDGKHLLFYRIDPRNQRDVWRVAINEDGNAGKPVPILATPFDEREPSLSADGSWLAYVSNRSGRHEVYVRPFPDGGEQQVSGNGGIQPRWRRDGRELYYVEDETLMAVSITTEPTFSIGSPERLFSDPGLAQQLPGSRQYDVTADGRRFILATPYAEAGESPPTIRVVQNWYEEFRGRENN